MHRDDVGLREQLVFPANNIQLAGVIRKAAAGEELTADEQFQFELRTNALLRYWEDVHYQFRQGLYDEVEFLTQKKAWRQSINNSIGFKNYWCKVKQLYSPLFMEALDELIAVNDC